jgi:phospholipid-binding lipoprotein MlaA
MFGFNRMVLENVVEPAIAFLGPRIPETAVTLASNVYSNFTEIEFVLNGLLVGDPQAVAVSTGRFTMNSTLGIAGLFDVASYVGLQRTERDFIESMCQTGLPPGPYIVFPLVGPANLYSAAALVTGVAVEVYLLSFISTTLAMADFILIDIGGTASSLRYMRELPLDTQEDSYLIQRDDHMSYVRRVCNFEPIQTQDTIETNGPGSRSNVQESREPQESIATAANIPSIPSIPTIPTITTIAKGK